MNYKAKNPVVIYHGDENMTAIKRRAKQKEQKGNHLPISKKIK